MSCYGTTHCFTSNSTNPPIGSKCDCGKETYENRESILEKEIQSNAELIDALRLEKLQLEKINAKLLMATKMQLDSCARMDCSVCNVSRKAIALAEGGNQS